MKNIVVLGLDPGLSNTGFAVAEVDPMKGRICAVREVGNSSTDRRNHKLVRQSSDQLRRAKLQAATLRNIIEKHEIDAIAMEVVGTTQYKYPTLSFGVMMGIVAALDLPVMEVTPREVKIAATRNERASKRDIIEWALAKTGKRRVGWPTSERDNHLGLTLNGKRVARAAEHPADALAAIEAAINAEQFRMGALFRR